MQKFKKLDIIYLESFGGEVVTNDGMWRKSVFGGFREDDVLLYVEQMNKDSAKLNGQLQKHIFNLKTENAGLKGEIEKLVNQLNEYADPIAIEKSGESNLQAEPAETQEKPLDIRENIVVAEALAPTTEMKIEEPVEVPETQRNVYNASSFSNINENTNDEIVKLVAEKTQLSIQNKGLKTQIAMLSRSIENLKLNNPKNTQNVNDILDAFNDMRVEITNIIGQINSYSLVNQVFSEEDANYLNTLFGAVTKALEVLLYKIDDINSVG